MSQAEWKTGEDMPILAVLSSLRAKVAELRDKAVADAEKQVSALTEMVKTHAQYSETPRG